PAAAPGADRRNVVEEGVAVVADCAFGEAQLVCELPEREQCFVGHLWILAAGTRKRNPAFQRLRSGFEGGFSPVPAAARAVQSGVFGLLHGVLQGASAAALRAEGI